MIITLTNNLHNTRVKLRVYDSFPSLSRRQVVRARHELCPSSECTCGETCCKTRGIQTHGLDIFTITQKSDGGASLQALPRKGNWTGLLMPIATQQKIVKYPKWENLP